MSSFSPIAIVGRACLLPGAATPGALWDHVAAGRSLIRTLTAARLGMEPGAVLGPPGAADRAYSLAGGWVEVPESEWRTAEAQGLDPLFHWVIHTGRTALEQAAPEAGLRTGAIIGNLSFPSQGMAEDAAARVLTSQGDRLGAGLLERLGLRPRDPRDRFMSGLPAHLLASALGLRAGATCLDAACASSLYAIRLAAERLAQGQADLMLAGAVSRADPLFLEIGFSALSALSLTGQSRPFDQDADGLLPAEGAAMVALMRLEDAIRTKRPILGVIRGVGLSNDGRARGLLAPSSEGQVRAMRAAYQMAGLRPTEVQLIEAHATGTRLGDETELQSLREVFAGASPASVRVGSLKGNLGHSITAAGMAGLLKVLGAFEVQQLPPTRCARPIPGFEGDSPFRLVSALEPWPEGPEPRRAAVSAFGFGGNNAHLIVEEHRPRAVPKAHPVRSAPRLGVVALRKQASAGQSRGVSVELEGVRFPPNDLQQALPQQLLALETTRALVHALEPGALRPESTAVIFGMGCDVRVTSYGIRWRAAAWAEALEPQQDASERGRWVEALRGATIAPLTAAGVLGTMPNLVANRLNTQLDLGGPSFTVSAEELSGVVALELAASLIRAGDVEAALVGAVETGEDLRHREAKAALTGTAAEPESSCVALLLMPVALAEARGLKVLVELESLELHSGGSAAAFPSAIDRGAAQGLWELATAGALLAGRARADGAGRLWPALLDAPEGQRRGLELAAIGGASAKVELRASAGLSARTERPTLLFLEGDDDRALHQALEAAKTTDREALRRATLERGRAEGAGARRAAIVLRDDNALIPSLERAQQLLAGAARRPGDELISLRSPVGGADSLAMVFGGAAAPYRGMGSGLLLAFPEVVDALSLKIPKLATAARADWIYGDRDRANPSYLDQLLAASGLMQAHATFSRTILGLRPAAAIGYSLGESNALLAFGAFSDAGAMLEEVSRSPLFREELAAPYRSARRWLEARGEDEWARAEHCWATYTVLASVTEVQRAIAAEPLAFISLINTDDECVISGVPAAVERVLEALDADALELFDAPAVHVPAALPAAAAYRALHRRPVAPVPGVRFYGHAALGAYPISTEACADALLGQATQTVDFPRLIRRAYDDGLRVFLDHGPRGLCAGWIGRILAGRPHAAIALDAPARDAELEALRATAALFTAGIAVDLARVLPPVSAAPLRPQAIGAPLASPRLELPPAPPPTPGRMPRPPRLPPIHAAPIEAEPIDEAPIAAEPLEGPAAILAAIADAHRAFLSEQSRAHQAYLELARADEARLIALSAGAVPVEQAPAPWLSRADLERAASGKLSEVLGPVFERQDGFRRQVRMPEPPLLLADRVLSISAEPGVLAPPASIVTETDVPYDAWYLCAGRVAPSVLIEAGQADLLLVSYMGVDFDNRGERVYRLLGCDLEYVAPLPPAGTTLHYDIHIDGFANHGDTRIFFFHSDCRAGGPEGEVLLRVRGGQAGFFSDAELDASAGVIFDPNAHRPREDWPRQRGPQISEKRAFSAAELGAWIGGDAYACFGPGFERALPHVATPTIAGGRLRLVDRVSSFDPRGGPWGRGHLLAELDLTPDSWFFHGHFKDDPCMPGTMMFEGALECLAIFLGAEGFTLARDGWRFEPSLGRVSPLRCRGQATPRSRRLVYEVLVKSLREDQAGPELVADVLVTVDGLKSLHAKDLGLRLVNAHPLERRAELLGHLPHPSGEDAVGGIGSPEDSRAIYDQTSLLATALGRPSQAFGEMYARFDQGRRIPRLPGPPYHFMSRVMELEGPGPGVFEAGGRAVVDYEVPPEAWFFEASRNRRMPFGVLLEVALQPCGWLSSYVGSALVTEAELYYRNLDGRATVHREIAPDVGTLRTSTRLTKSSRSGDMIIQEFALDVRCSAGLVLEATTTFGFFPGEALRAQIGLGSHSPRGEDAPRIQGPSLGERFLPAPMLRMIDRITDYWPRGGKASLGRVRAEKTVDPGEWFFKAHFFQDPVQPGSLGIEAMLQAVAWLAGQRGLAGPGAQRCVVLDLGVPIQWKYRGQVLPSHTVVRVDVELTSIDAGGITAEGSLWADDLRIYHATGLSLRFVDAP
ncbi:MAG: beta-ketoacyl synthase N-terminal-like domain-containing protein [Myxococcota bacterium]